MSPSQIKGALLEFLVRKLLRNCGFTSVKPDGHYVFEQIGNGLFFVNGKGAAHDADVLMEPPIQLPFSYPSRLLFECKAYKNNVGLGVIRNVLGLRYDINEFEIITDESVLKRKNNKRSKYAISDRTRYNYQVGVASVEPFSSSAFEFAANNKIPLLSLSWFIPETTLSLFNSINRHYIYGIAEPIRIDLFSYLKNKSDSDYYDNGINSFLENDEIIGSIIRGFNSVINQTIIGLTETGDLIFLFSEGSETLDYFFYYDDYGPFRARIHYYRNNPNQWLLQLRGESNNISYSFRFFVPKRLMKLWREHSLDKNVAINIKEEFLSRIFLFKKQQQLNEFPFIIVNIDRDWLDSLRN